MTKVSIIEIVVSDMDLGRAFYCDKLGFEVKSDAYLPDVIVMEHDGVDLVLSAGKQPISIDYPDTSGTRLIFEVDDIHAAHQDYLAKGIEIIDGPRDFPPGEYMAFKDPFSNVHGLTQLREEPA
ncbi:MAG: VOC family protein [Chloroflexota bacterium]